MAEALLCPHCREPNTEQPPRADMLHAECLHRLMVGGLNHQLGLCHCYGGTLDPDLQGMTRRQAAVVASIHARNHAIKPMSSYRIDSVTGALVAADGEAGDPDSGYEFDCCECGRHIIAFGNRALEATHPDLCAACWSIPGWFNDAEIAALLDPENTRRPRRLQ